MIDLIKNHPEIQEVIKDERGTPSPWLTLLSVLGKNRVNQVKWYRFIQNQVKSALVKEFMFHSMC